MSDQKPILDLEEKKQQGNINDPKVEQKRRTIEENRLKVKKDS